MYRQALAREREWLSYGRDIYRALPYHASTYGKSAAVLAAFPHTIRDLSRRAQSRAIEFPEVGIDPELFSGVDARPVRKRKTILFVGRLVPYKQAHILVRAFADRPALRQHRLSLSATARSVQRSRSKFALVVSRKALKWRDGRTQAEVAAFMREADISLFRRFGNSAQGSLLRPWPAASHCVVVDYGGPSVLIEEDRGMKVRLGDEGQLTRDFGDALERLVATKVRAFNWARQLASMRCATTRGMQRRARCSRSMNGSWAAVPDLIFGPESKLSTCSDLLTATLPCVRIYQHQGIERTVPASLAGDDRRTEKPLRRDHCALMDVRFAGGAE